MGKKKWENKQKSTGKKVTDTQQPKQAALAPNVADQQQNDPAELATSLPQGHTQEEVPDTSTQKKPTERHLEVPKEELTLSTTNLFSKLSFGPTAQTAPKNETPPSIFGIPSFGPQTAIPFSFRATVCAGNTNDNTREPPEFSFGAADTMEKKNSNQGEEEKVTDTNTDTAENTDPTQPKDMKEPVFSIGLSTTGRNRAGKKPAGAKNPKKWQPMTKDLGVGVGKAEQPQANIGEIIETIDRTMDTMSPGPLVKNEYVDLIVAALRDKKFIEGPEPEGNKVIDPKVSFLVKGMRSRRVSLFNPLLQILLGLRTVREVMARPGTKGALSSPLRNIFMETNGSEEEGEEKKEEKDLVGTDDLFSNICSIWGSQYRDMDSKQLLVSILDVLHKEEVKAYKLVEDSHTIIEKIFRGELWDGSRFLALSLQVPCVLFRPLLIKDCMDMLVKECGVEKPIRKAPLIFVIHLKNNTHTYGSTEDELDIQQFVHSTRENDTDTIYRLVGVLCCEGNNYIAYVRGGSIRLKRTIKHCDWVYARDEEVAETSFRSIRGHSELLFYERIGDQVHLEDKIRSNKKDEIKEKKEDIRYKTKMIHFLSGPTRIVLEDNNAPCPLIPVYNVLLLGGKVTLHSDEVTKRRILKNIKQLLKGETSLMVDVKADLNMMFSRTYLFEPTPEVNLLDYLKVRIHHGWVFKPESDLASALYEHSYKGLVSMDDSSHSEMVLEFLKGPQVTEYGLTCLRDDLEENTPALLFCNNQFSTIVKVNGTVYMLVAEACEAGVVWKKLEVNGGGQLMDSAFAPINFEMEGVSGRQPRDTNFAPIDYEEEGKESSSLDNTNPQSDIMVYECDGARDEARKNIQRGPNINICIMIG